MKIPPTFQLILFLTLISLGVSQETQSITLLHFSDYHSHAQPFYSEGESDVAGLARAIAYLKPFADDSETLIFSGGDMINKGSPAWSDKYQYEEWTWFNNIIDAMAFGNHDADYGFEAFKNAQSSISYPILGSNVLNARGGALFHNQGKTYEIFNISDLRIGVFAVVGEDFNQLLKPETMPTPLGSFSDRIETARHMVKMLREIEKVDAVIVIGHALYEEDITLAQTVPGIDLIFGSHSHRKENLRLIPGTKTSIISPGQYLTHISKVELQFNKRKLFHIQGELVRMKNSLPEDHEIKAWVDQMGVDLQNDPDFAELYPPIGSSAIELATSGQFTGESLLGNLVCDIVRNSAQSHAAILTSSGFRQAIPPGTILEQDLLTALPYKNSVYVFDLLGSQIEEILNFSVDHLESDHFSQVAGLRFSILDGTVKDLKILSDPNGDSSPYIPINSDQVYQVATSNYQALYASGYKDLFAGLPHQKTELDVWEEIRGYLKINSPVSITLDGRMSNGPAVDVQKNTVGPSDFKPSRWSILAIGVLILIAWLSY